MKSLEPNSREMRHLLQASMAPSPDPAFVPFAAASAEEIHYAQQLRRRIEERYLNRPAPALAPWTVGAD
jgi:hypothetical protein